MKIKINIFITCIFTIFSLVSVYSTEMIFIEHQSNFYKGKYSKQMLLDVNKDRNIDLLAFNNETNELALFINPFDKGRFDSLEFDAPIVLEKFNNSRVHIAGYDYDRDGDVDILATLFLENKIVVYENNNTDFKKKVIIDDIANPEFFLVRDLDCDGRYDIIAYSYSKFKVYFYQRKKDGTYTKKTIASNLQDVTQIEIANINTDSKNEVLVLDKKTNKIHIYQQFSHAFGETKNIPLEIEDKEFYVRKLNEKSDYKSIIIPNFKDLTIKAFTINQDGIFDLDYINLSLNSFSAFEAADFDADGEIDRFIAGENKVEIQRNIKLNGFRNVTLNSEIESPAKITVLDWDFDNHLDFVILSENSNEISIFEMTVISSIPPPILEFPAEGAEEISIANSWTWEGQYDKVLNFQFELSKYIDFHEILIDTTIYDGETFNENDTLLSYDTRYFWRVRNVGYFDTSAWSEIRSFRSEKFGPVYLRMPLDSGENISRTPLLTWRKMISADYYKILVSENQNLKNPIIEVNNIEEAEYAIQNILKPNFQYFWRVTAYNHLAESIPSAIRTFFTGTHTPVQENEFNISIYPNPTADLLYINGLDYNNIKPYFIKIYDINGKPILTNIINSNQSISVSGLSTGTYNMRIIQQGEVIFQEQILILR